MSVPILLWIVEATLQWYSGCCLAFTREGHGTLVSVLPYSGARGPSWPDVGGAVELLAGVPLLQEPLGTTGPAGSGVSCGSGGKCFGGNINGDGSGNVAVQDTGHRGGLVAQGYTF